MDKESVDFLRAIGAALAVFVPLIVFWLQKKDKLQKTKYFIELMRSHEELKNIRVQLMAESASAAVMGKIDKLLKEIDEEINYTVDRDRVLFFVLMIFIEAVVLAVFFSEWSEYINMVMVGPSYESGLSFLEGIFKSTTARLMLLMVFVSLSVFITIKSARPLIDKISKPRLRNFVMVLAFNLILIVVTVVISLILALLDPIVPLW